MNYKERIIETTDLEVDALKIRVQELELNYANLVEKMASAQTTSAGLLAAEVAAVRSEVDQVRGETASHWRAQEEANGAGAAAVAALGERVAGVVDDVAQLRDQLTICSSHRLTIDHVRTEATRVIAQAFGVLGGQEGAVVDVNESTREDVNEGTVREVIKGEALEDAVKGHLETYFAAVAQLGQRLDDLTLKLEAVNGSAVEGLGETRARLLTVLTDQLTRQSREISQRLDRRVETIIEQASTSFVEQQQSSANSCGKYPEANNGGSISFTAEIGGGGYNASMVEAAIAAALRQYDADRTGQADFAMESAGGTILNTRCTESHELNTATMSWFGIPFYHYSPNTPRTIIQPGRQPGNCWAFKGSQGMVVIKLLQPVRISAFSLEHIPRDIAPAGHIKSAPQNFSVWGLHTEKDEGVCLGNFVYTDHPALYQPVQFFPVQNVSNDVYFPMVELKIHSNHGNQKYTCVYRIRVHGTPYSPLTA